jgi:hypothetical protein
MVMIYKVVKNGDTIIVTRSYKNAAETYEREIFNAKDPMIIRMYAKRDGSDEWELARKDWL